MLDKLRLYLRILAPVFIIYTLLPVIFGTPYQLRVLNMIACFTTIAITFNLLFGHTRQLFLSQGALMGISAYTSTLLSMKSGIHTWITLPIGAFISGITGSLISFVSAVRRLSEIYVAILTLAFQMMFLQLAISWREVTGGSEGYIPPDLGLSIFGNRELAYYCLFFITLLVAFFAYTLIIHSRIGLGIDAIYNDEDGAESCGISIRKFKVLVGFIASLILGFIGSIYGYYNLYVSPAFFEFTSIDIPVLIMVILGGIRTSYGPLLGAGIIVLLSEILRPLGKFAVLIFSVLLVTLALFFRRGVVPYLSKLKSY